MCPLWLSLWWYMSFLENCGDCFWWQRELSCLCPAIMWVDKVVEVEVAVDLAELTSWRNLSLFSNGRKQEERNA